MGMMGRGNVPGGNPRNDMVMGFVTQRKEALIIFRKRVSQLLIMHPTASWMIMKPAIFSIPLWHTAVCRGCLIFRSFSPSTSQPGFWKLLLAFNRHMPARVGIYLFDATDNQPPLQSHLLKRIRLIRFKVPQVLHAKGKACQQHPCDTSKPMHSSLRGAWLVATTKSLDWEMLVARTSNVHSMVIGLSLMIF